MMHTTEHGHSPSFDPFTISVKIHARDKEDFDSRPSCAVLPDISESSPSWGPDFDDVPDPLILQYSPDVFRELSPAVIRSGAIVRVDTPGDGGIPGAWPAIARDAAGLDEILHLLLSQCRKSNLYPISIWGIPSAKEEETINAIEAFRVLRMDRALFDQILIGSVTSSV
ncbi:MAG TPA: hypothetical protein VF188_06555 [Longimicrobiales bacterium]